MIVINICLVCYIKTKIVIVTIRGVARLHMYFCDENCDFSLVLAILEHENSKLEHSLTATLLCPEEQ